MRSIILAVLLVTVTGCISREQLVEGTSEVGGAVVTGFLQGGPLGAVVGGGAALAGAVFGVKKACAAKKLRKTFTHTVGLLMSLGLDDNKVVETLAQIRDSLPEEEKPVFDQAVEDCGNGTS